MATIFSPRDLTSSTSHSPCVVSSTERYDPYPVSNAFDSNTSNNWLGVHKPISVPDLLMLDLDAVNGVKDFAPHDLTSNTSHSPIVVSCSSNYGGYDPFRTLEGAGAYWIGTTNGVDWVGYDFGDGNTHIVLSYGISVNWVPEPNRAPKDWTFEGSNNNFSTFDVLDTVTNQTSWYKGEIRTFACDVATTAYRYFRINITANNGDAQYTQINEVYFYEPAVNTDARKICGDYVIQVNGETARAPKAWTLQASNNIATWDTLDTVTGQTDWSGGEERTFTCDTITTAYQFFRLSITDNNGDSTYTQVGEWYMYEGTPASSEVPVSADDTVSVSVSESTSRATVVSADDAVSISTDESATKTITFSAFSANDTLSTSISESVVITLGLSKTATFSSSARVVVIPTSPAETVNVAITESANTATPPEIEPLNQSYGSVTNLAYFDPQPTNLIDATETFGSIDTLTQYTEASAGVVSVSGNQCTIAHDAEENDLVTITGSSFALPQAFVSIQVDQKGSSGGYDNVGVGLIKDANNFLVLCWDNTANSPRIQIKIGGSNNWALIGSGTLPDAPFTLALSLVGNAAAIWLYSGGAWSVRGYHNIGDYYDFRTTGNLTGWKAGFSVASNSTTTWKFSNLKYGRFGGVGMRDMSIVTNEDGTPYIDGNKVTFTATLADPNGFDASGGSYCGVLTLDLSNNAIAQVAALMVSRDGKTYNDHAAHIIWYSNGDRRLLISTWGNYFGGSLQVLHGLLTSGDILSGSNVVSGLTQLSLPLDTSGAGAYDPFLVYDSVNSRWLIAYAITDSTSAFGPFYIAAAYSSDLSSFTLIDADSGNAQYEGPKILYANGAYWILGGGPASGTRKGRIYNSAMAYQGDLAATFSSPNNNTQPHPMVFAYGNYFYLLTFNDTRFGTPTFTWGQPSLQSAPRWQS